MLAVIIIVVGRLVLMKKCESGLSLGPFAFVGPFLHQKILRILCFMTAWV